MSIATQIQRLQALKQRLMTKVISWGEQPQDLDDCVTAVEAIDGTFDITDTNTKDIVGHGNRYARVSDRNLIPGNIVRGVSILGVTGTASVNPPQANIEKNKTWYYGGAAAPSIITPSSGYDAMAQVAPELTDATPALVPTNIKNGAVVMGVTGTYQTPTEAKAPTLADLKTLGITSHDVTITPSNNKHLSQVTIPRITSAIDSNILAGNIRDGVSILGVTGTYVESMDYFSAYNNETSSSSATTNLITFNIPSSAQGVLTSVNQIMRIHCSLYYDIGNPPADHNISAFVSGAAVNELLFTDISPLIYPVIDVTSVTMQSYIAIDTVNQKIRVSAPSNLYFITKQAIDGHGYYRLTIYYNQ